MRNVYENIDECNPGKKDEVLIVFDDMIVDMLSNKKVNKYLLKCLFAEEN